MQQQLGPGFWLRHASRHPVTTVAVGWVEAGSKTKEKASESL